ncbi:hypothetical protein FOB89_01615 [Shewanella putrefaciens]|nr:hypothetical protein FOB89_01615 [Shewanella putrefaciens]
MRQLLTLGIVSCIIVVKEDVFSTTIETILMLKLIFKLSLRATEGLINSLFKIVKTDLTAPYYSCISKRTKTEDIKYCNPPIAER